jgi:hypothetical protein
MFAKKVQNSGYCSKDNAEDKSSPPVPSKTFSYPHLNSPSYNINFQEFNYWGQLLILS